MPRKLIVAAGQMGPASDDKDANVQTVLAPIDEAARTGARIVSMPELSLTKYFGTGWPPPGRPRPLRHRPAPLPKAPPGSLWHRYGTKTGSGTPGVPEVPDRSGEPWRSRTSNLLIKRRTPGRCEDTQPGVTSHECERTPPAHVSADGRRWGAVGTNVEPMWNHQEPAWLGASGAPSRAASRAIAASTARATA